jgi:hypothetical protein
MRTGQEKNARGKTEASCLETSIERCDRIELLSVAVLIFALTGELVTTTSHPLASKICGWIVVFSITGEFIAHIFLWRKSKKLVALQKRELNEISLETAKANEQAVKARLELEKYKAPRSLNPQQRSEFTAGLSKLSPQKTEFWICGNIPETHTLALIISNLMLDSGWNVSLHQPLGIPASGIFVVTQIAPDTSRSTADKLWGLLLSAGLVANRRQELPRMWALRPDMIGGEDAWDVENGARIRMIIGIKP